jgi:hypothetical protein
MSKQTIQSGKTTRARRSGGPQTAEGRARALANLKPFQPGQSGNPAGRKTAGATIREWLNVLAEAKVTERELRTIARDQTVEWSKRTAAERMLRTLEAGDLADFQPYLHGEKSLDELKAAGINTEIVKKCKVKIRTLENGTTETEREVELFDRAGADFDRVLDRTEGKPRQVMEIESAGVAPQVIVMRHGSRQALPEVSRN